MNTTLKPHRITLDLVALARRHHKAEYKAEQGLIQDYPITVRLLLKDGAWLLALTCWLKHASEDERAGWANAFGIEAPEWRPTIKAGWQTMWCQWSGPEEARQVEMQGMESKGEDHYRV